MRFNLCLLCSQVKARGAVHTVGVEQRHGGQTELSADCSHFLGQGRAFEKAESRAGMKLDVHFACTCKSLATDQHGFTRIRTNPFVAFLLRIFLSVLIRENPWQTFSHTFLPQTIRRLANRERGGRKKLLLRFAEQGPTHRGTRLRAPTSRRRSARGRLSRAHRPGLLSSWRTPDALADRFPQSQWRAAGDGNGAEP